MDKFVIRGGKPLKGEITVSGAKNASLALMPAAILANGTVKIYNTPRLNDVFTMSKLLNSLGATTELNDHELIINAQTINNQVAPYELVKKMRASFYVLGPLVSKFGYAKVSLPGGCAWGPRPINLHIEGLKRLGAQIDLEDGYIVAKAKKLHGARINFDTPSVGATGNVLMAAVLAKGGTIINNAAMEPEISNLAEFLVKMGAKISGINTSILEVEGVDYLDFAAIETIPDRIEAGTLLVAAAMTRGEIKINNLEVKHIYSIIAKLEESGLKMTYNGNHIKINAADFSPRSINVATGPFPGYPTDMQAQWIAYMAVADSSATITDNIYFDRFAHVPELMRLGADITVKDNSAVVKGVKKLKGAKIMSTDLRASASLVLGGLAAEGTTEVLRIYHLDRGYENLEMKLKALGADIERVKTEEF